MINIVIGIWFTITPPVNLVTDSTAVMIVEASLDIPYQEILDINNYVIVDDSGKQLQIHSANAIGKLDGDFPIGSKLAAFVTNKLDYRKVYTITMTGRGSFYFFNNGYAPNLEPQPYLITK